MSCANVTIEVFTGRYSILVGYTDRRPRTFSSGKVEGSLGTRNWTLRPAWFADHATRARGLRRGLRLVTWLWDWYRAMNTWEPNRPVGYPSYKTNTEIFRAYFINRAFSNRWNEGDYIASSGFNVIKLVVHLCSVYLKGESESFLSIVSVIYGKLGIFKACLPVVHIQS